MKPSICQARNSLRILFDSRLNPLLKRLRVNRPPPAEQESSSYPFSRGNQNCLQGNMLSAHDLNMSKNYIVQKGKSYVVLVEENGQTIEEAHITDAKVFRQIKHLLAERRKAGKKLTKLLIAKGPITASAHNHVTVELGEGDEQKKKKSGRHTKKRAL